MRCRCDRSVAANFLVASVLHFVVTSAAPALVAAAEPGSAKVRDISGMAAFADNTSTHQRFLVVRDLKETSDAARLQVLTVDESGRSRADDVASEPSEWGQWLPNDLESADPVPGTANEFVVVESGFRGDKFGRVFRVAIEQRESGYYSNVKQLCRLPQTGRWFNIEGSGCFSWNGRLWLLLGDRATWSVSGDTHQTSYSALFLTRLPESVETGSVSQLEWTEIGRVVAPGFDGKPTDNFRHCSGIHLAPSELDPGKLTVWISAAFDPDIDAGPFMSQVFRAGTLNLKAASPVDLLPLEPSPQPQWLCDGIKIEAVSSALTASGILSIGTDDESNPGLWRPLGSPAARTDPGHQ